MMTATLKIRQAAMRGAGTLASTSSAVPS